MFTNYSTQRMARTFRRGGGASGIQSSRTAHNGSASGCGSSVFAQEKHGSRRNGTPISPPPQIVEHLLGKGYGVVSAMQSEAGSKTSEVIPSICSDFANFRRP